MNKKNIIICRCEDISLQQIHELLEQGYTTFEDLKRLLRVGMGPCQANTCGHLIQREIAKYLDKNIEEIKVHKTRPMIVGVPLKSIAKGQSK
ncbi:MAG TPA: (2Fe-2S)-binding protein [Bacilli bacterium]|jgi:bacterioferritin-associated ferredoxin|nr:(2Fe-2S)-binding protein [Acholeplasmataceae bacterium]HHY22069.1 (2Fe-2S)-binding protein [Bacilli bacterium]